VDTTLNRSLFTISKDPCLILLFLVQALKGKRKINYLCFKSLLEKSHSHLINFGFRFSSGQSEKGSIIDSKVSNNEKKSYQGEKKSTFTRPEIWAELFYFL
jgi:hypothetical protein